MTWVRELTGAKGALGLGLAMAAGCLISMASPAWAQDDVSLTKPGSRAAAQGNQMSEAVAAIVNDEVISSYDLRQRMMLLIVTSGVQPTEENIPELQREALRSLVDERLELQEVRHQEKEQKFHITLEDSDIDAEIAAWARQNNQTPDQFLGALRQAGVGPQTIRDQIQAERSWQRWIQGRYGSRLRIGDDQVKAALARMTASASKPQYQVAEIFIDAQRAGGMDAAEKGAEQLVDQLQQGAPFPAVARQFSASPTAASGGDAGWLSSGEMAPEVEAALEQLRPGQLSKPIPVKDGVYIIYLRDKRAGASATLVDLKQAAVRLAADASPADIAAAQKKLLELKPQIKSCETLEATAGKVDGVLAGDLGEAEIKDLSPAFQQAATTLSVGQISDPIRSDAGLHLVMVCGKRQSGAETPTKDQIQDRLFSQQLALISKRYLRDLRNSATIETR